MSTDAGSGFDNQAAGRDAGDERLEEETATSSPTTPGASRTPRGGRRAQASTTRSTTVLTAPSRRNASAKQSQENVNDRRSGAGRR